MASYLLDVIWVRNLFSRMDLSWHVAELPVHVYFNILWENRYTKSYALICDEFIARVYFILFKKECLRLSAVAKKMISKVGHWDVDKHTTYIRVFGATRAPHLLLDHVLDRLIMGEICYHTILQGYNTTLVKDKKRAFMPYEFHVGFYLVKTLIKTNKKFWVILNSGSRQAGFASMILRSSSSNKLHKFLPVGHMRMTILRMGFLQNVLRTGRR